MREDIEIKLDLDPGLTSALADAGQLESAVYNLAINAQDAMPSGGCLTLTTSHASLDRHSHSLHPDIPPGEYVVISVMDNGEGMSREVREHAFEPFYTTKEVGKGSGLGLSMVYGFAKQSNGHISIYSEPGLGTTVRLYLPQVASDVPRANDKSAAESALLPRGTERILVVEDDPFVRSLTVRQLKSLDYEVLVAAGVEDALHKLRSDAKIDVLFTDIVMPGATNGWELAELAKRIRPRLPVLLTSGYALETLVKQGRLQQGVVVLAKPYRKETLALRLREVLLVGSMLDRRRRIHRRANQGRCRALKPHLPTCYRDRYVLLPPGYLRAGSCEQRCIGPDLASRRAISRLRLSRRDSVRMEVKPAHASPRRMVSGSGRINRISTERSAARLPARARCHFAGMCCVQGFEFLPSDGRAEQVEQVLRTGFFLDVGAMIFDCPRAQSVQPAHFLVALSQQGLSKDFPLTVGEGCTARQVQ